MLANINKIIKVMVSGLILLRPPLRFANGLGKLPTKPPLPKPLPPNGLLFRLKPPPPKPELLMRRSYLLLGGAFTTWILGGIG